MNERERIGIIIFNLRKESGLTQVELSKEAKITQSNLARIEAGRYSPGLDVLAKVADALDKKIDFICK